MEKELSLEILAWVTGGVNSPCVQDGATENLSDDIVNFIVKKLTSS